LCLISLNRNSKKPFRRETTTLKGIYINQTSERTHIKTLQNLKSIMTECRSYLTHTQHRIHSRTYRSYSGIETVSGGGRKIVNYGWLSR
jgi:hypothetical protein